MLSRAPRQAEMELRWTLVGLQLLGLMSVGRIVESCEDPLRWSVAAALRVVRSAMRDHKPRGSSRDGLPGCLSRAVKDRYRRRNKQARDWPHKKKEKPPGAPKCRKASRTEVDKAQEIKARKMAA